MSVPIIDIDVESDVGIWSQALAGRTRAAGQLVRALRRELEGATPRPLLATVKAAVGTLHRLFGRHYGDEVDELATLLGATPAEIVLANIYYDLAAGGCSTFVQPTPAGPPLVARTRDWYLPRQLLRKHTTVFRVHAPCGPYATVSYPGLIGALTGIAPGRFAIAINYVRHASESGWAKIAGRGLKGYWPTTWVVRQALDHAATFADAVRHLSRTPLLAPVMFTVAGTAPGEGVVIERTPDRAVFRRMGDSPVCVTNHYVSDDLIDSNEGIEEIDTAERLDALERGLATNVVHDAKAALKLLSRKSLMSEITAHQVVARPHDGMCVVRVPGQKAVDLG
jgi:acid ceramidase